MPARPAFRLLLITDRTLGRLSLTDAVRAALAVAPSGSVAVQLREKDLGAREVFDLAAALLPICRARGAPLLVNDRIDVALALDLEGVHLPQASFTAGDARRLLGLSKIIGVSCHSTAEVERASDQGASYATFGPVFDTPSKRAFGPPLGLNALESAAALRLPLFALGGLNAANAPQALERGATGIATIGAWLGAGSDDDPPGPAVARFLSAMTGVTPYLEGPPSSLT